jgi:hypothetical protein
VGWDWVHLVRWPLTGLLHLTRMVDECGAVGGKRIGRGNRSTRRKPAPVPLCPPQIPHDLTWARTRAAAVGSRRLTAWAMAWPYIPDLTATLNMVARALRRIELKGEFTGLSPHLKWRQWCYKDFLNVGIRICVRKMAANVVKCRIRYKIFISFPIWNPECSTDTCNF